MSQDTKPTPMTIVGKRNRWEDRSTNSTMLKALAYRVDWLLKHHVGQENFLQVFDKAEAEAEAEDVMIHEPDPYGLIDTEKVIDPSSASVEGE